jgi:hypothetical protein
MNIVACRAVSRQHVSTTTNQHTTIEVLLEAVFSAVVSVEDIYAGRSEVLVVGREPPFREDMSPEAGIVKAVTRKLQVKTLRAGKD